jgi:hypothetical protein
MSQPERYRKKPVVVEALQYADDPVPILAWLGSTRCSLDDDGLTIQTVEGVYEVFPGDWVIRGVWGEVYCCAPRIFEEAYERISKV